MKKDITQLDVDCIVNAANAGLHMGGGVCGAIFSAAGPRELEKACREYGHCPTGSAVITPGFRLKAQWIVHAVGPIWQGGQNGERELLKSCYRKSMELAREKGCRSIAFPLISSGIFGYPKEEAWQVALESVQSFQKQYPEERLDVIIGVLTDEALSLGQRVLDFMNRSF